LKRFVFCLLTLLAVVEATAQRYDTLKFEPSDEWYRFRSADTVVAVQREDSATVTGLRSKYEIAFATKSRGSIYRDKELIARFDESEIRVVDRIFTVGEGSYKGHWGYFLGDQVVFECHYDKTVGNKHIELKFSNLSDVEQDVMTMISVARAGRYANRTPAWMPVTYGVFFGIMYYTIRSND
jgi:hypothetical protein